MQRKTILKISAALIAVAVVAVSTVAFLVLNYGWWFAGIPASDAKLSNAGYLRFKSGNFMEESRLYLVTATAAYGTHNGQGCFIINATIRSDYTLQNKPVGGANSSSAYFGLIATLYHNNGRVEGNDVTGNMPPLGVPQHLLESGETEWFEIDVATLNRNIDSYSIGLASDVENQPLP